MIESKFADLSQTIHSMGSVVVAYSGGIDSTLLLKVAHDCLADRALALTAVSSSFPSLELDEAKSIASYIGAQHILIDTFETEDPRYQENTPNRCFFCKHNVYDEIVRYAQQHGFRYVIDGTNADDVGDHRPGRKAAREHGVRSPLQEVGLSKSEIRHLAQRLALPNWDKPAAACLSSRIPYGTSITVELLSQIERAERLLYEMGFRQLRVRHHGQLARIELPPDEFVRLLSLRDEIIVPFNNLGFQYVTLDLVGFRSGSMNEVLKSHGR
ncbi:MAG: ATP-dependent sacrificial sulfur transferase LarE [Anaerolineales bacterium]